MKTVVKAIVLLMTAALTAVFAVAAVVPVKSAAELGGAGYTVSLYEGKVAVFTDGQTAKPAAVTDIAADSLRRHDRQELEKGVFADTEEEVLRLLEDYGS